MKALILNSGLGSRMGSLTAEHPKCMTEIASGETIVSRQLSILVSAGIDEIIMTTGFYDEVLRDYCTQLELPVKITFVNNIKYDSTNYIYSIYCAREYLDDDILLLHGDMVFEAAVLDLAIACAKSCMVVSSTTPLSKKDFKAVVVGGEIKKIGVEFTDSAVTAQPFYKILKKGWIKWLERIVEYCEVGNYNCYAENAFNDISGEFSLAPLDVKDILCREIDNSDDLEKVSELLVEAKSKTVYLCFSTDLLHTGHINLINRAKRLGKLILGVLSDEVVASYKRFPLVLFEERKAMFENIKGVESVIMQDSLSYKTVLNTLRPDYVVHGDDWINGFQRPVRDEVISILKGYGGTLLEYPYSRNEQLDAMEDRVREELSLPHMRSGRLKQILKLKGFATAIEAHSGITGLIAEQTIVYQNEQARQFDAMWVSSLCDSTAKGKPDIELVDMTSRLRTIDDIMEVTTKPIIFDGDTGGLTEHFVYTVKSLERMGVSMVIIEDKTGLKKNSLFGTEVDQTQDSIEDFCAKISAGAAARKTHNFMICARIESLILEKGMNDALKRAVAYVEAGADAIMIHSRRKEPDEIFEFVEHFRAKDSDTPLVVVPTSFNTVTEEEFIVRGVNMVIYANQLTRTGIPAMMNAARTILENHRAKECDDICMSIKEILTLIPEDY